MYKLLYTEEAEKDLSSVYSYIAADSEQRAVNYLAKIEQCVLKLQSFPELGKESRFAALRQLGIRMLSFEDYLIFYTLNRSAETATVIRVLHGSVNYVKLF